MRRTVPAITLATLTLCALASGCSGPRGGFPTLTVRPAERAYYQAVPVEPTAAPTTIATQPDAKLADRLAALVASAQTARQRFLDLQPKTDRLTAAAQGSAMGGEAWSVAQLSLATLESARNDTSAPLADLDAMLLAHQLEHGSGPSPDLDAINAAHAQISNWATQESATVNAFAARLAS